MRRFAVLSIVAAFLLLAVSSGAYATDKMYMTATGSKTGVIKGGLTQKGFEGWMAVNDFAQSMAFPIDQASGLPAGVLQHQPVKVKIPLDKATPVLMNVFANNELLTRVKIDFWRVIPGAGGVITQRKVFYVQLTNAHIVGASLTNPNPLKPAEDAALELSFTYQRMEQTWIDGGITAIIDWQTPLAVAE